MKPSIKVLAKNGDLNIKNVSENPFDAEFKITMYTKKKSFKERFFDLFTDSACECTIYVDRKQGKLISTFIHNELTSADKVYKESKELTKEVVSASEEKPKKKRTYKPRKKKTDTTTTTNS
jgi:hypothetical protein